MLEIVDVPVHGRKTGFMAGDSPITPSTSTYKKGSFVVASGTFSASDISSLPAAQKNKPGWASAGDVKLVRAWAGSGGRAYPMDKIIMVPEDGNDDSDTVQPGEMVTYYTAGTFRTSEFTDVGSAVFGDYLKATASGTLTIEATATTETGDSVARVEVLHNANTNAKDHRLEFTIVSGDN